MYRAAGLLLAAALALVTAFVGLPGTSHASDALIDSVFIHVPRGLPSGTPARVLVAFHGVNETGPSFARQLVAEADRQHWVLIAPTIRYGDWWSPEIVAREDVLISRWLVEYLDTFERERSMPLESKVLLFGFSRGAGLAGRVALLQPQRVAAVTVTSSGGYTVPQTQDTSGAVLAYPFGVADLASYNGRDFDKQAFAAIRWSVGVGSQDDAARDVPQIWSRSIGATRLQRARALSAALTAAGAEAKLSVFADTGHVLTPLMRGEALAFLHSADPTPWVAPIATVIPTPAPTPHASTKASTKSSIHATPSSTLVHFQPTAAAVQETTAVTPLLALPPTETRVAAPVRTAVPTDSQPPTLTRLSDQPVLQPNSVPPEATSRPTLRAGPLLPNLSRPQPQPAPQPGLVSTEPTSRPVVQAGPVPSDQSSHSAVNTPPAPSNPESPPLPTPTESPSAPESQMPPAPPAIDAQAAEPTLTPIDPPADTPPPVDAAPLDSPPTLPQDSFLTP